MIENIKRGTRTGVETGVETVIKRETEIDIKTDRQTDRERTRELLLVVACRDISQTVARSKKLHQVLSTEGSRGHHSTLKFHRFLGAKPETTHFSPQLAHANQYNFLEFPRKKN